MIEERLKGTRNQEVRTLASKRRKCAHDSIWLFCQEKHPRHGGVFGTFGLIYFNFILFLFLENRIEKSSGKLLSVISFYSISIDREFSASLPFFPL